MIPLRSHWCIVLETGNRGKLWMSFQQENFHSTSFYSDSSLKLNQEIYICQILAAFNILELEGPYIIIQNIFASGIKKMKQTNFLSPLQKILKGQLSFPEPSENLSCKVWAGMQTNQKYLYQVIYLCISMHLQSCLRYILCHFGANPYQHCSGSSDLGGLVF